MNRRSFLSSATTLAVGGSVPTLWRRAASAAGPGHVAPILVLIELTGGNDGLNTVVPFLDDAYQRARPTLRVAPDEALKLDDALGLHPALTGLQGLWDDGKLRVLMNVGYPDPSRSHFRSMEIWQAGATGPDPTSGWIGRLADSESGRIPPCFVGDGAAPLAVRGRSVAPFALDDIRGARLRPGARLEVAAGPAHDLSPLARASRAAEAALALSGRVAEVDAPAERPADEALRGRLDTIRALIEAGAGPRVYYTSLDGFDTHANQKYAHRNLLRKLSEAVAGFQADLQSRTLDDRVAVLIFSEFGRRVAENGSGGTDHGTAAPVLIVGSPVAGGILGGPPDLAHLDDGDVRFSLDFRDVYASILSQWLRVDPSTVLGPGRDDTIALFNR